MKVFHDCKIPVMDLSTQNEIMRVNRRWRCPVCGQYWFITYWYGGSMEAQRIAASGLKNWIWQKRAGRRLRG